MPLPSNTHRIALLPGDGIGTEVTAATLAVLEPLAKRHGLGLAYDQLRAGAFCYRDTGTAMSEETFGRAAKADAILLGKDSLVSLHDSRANVAVINALLESARVGKSISIDYS